MFLRLLLAAGLALCAFGSDIVGFEDVEYFDRSIESGKVKKRDGMLSIDRETGVIAFTSENRLWVSITSNRVTQCTYDDKDDRKLVVQYSDARERTRTAEFKLKGGNRENILQVLASETQGKLQRIIKK